MLPVRWYDYLLRPCVFITHEILKTVSSLLALWLFSNWPLPTGKSEENLPLWFFFVDVCGFTTQGGFSEEGNSFPLCRVSENHGRGVCIFRLGARAVRLLEALCPPCVVGLASHTWPLMPPRDVGSFWPSALPLGFPFKWKFKNSPLHLVLFFCSFDNPEQLLDFIVIHLQILPSQKSYR